MRNRLALPFALLFALVSPAGPAAAAREARLLARIAVQDGVVNDAFAFDDRGSRLAYVQTDARGTVVLRVGPPGKRASRVDLTRFSVVPERVFHVGGSWFVVANEGKRKAAVVSPGGQIRAQIPSFGDCLTANAKGPLFVTVTERGRPGRDRVHDVAVYRPDGSSLLHRQITIAPDESLVGYPGLTFVGFTNGFLGAVVRQPGKYDRKADVRGHAEVAVLDFVTGKTGPAVPITDAARFTALAAARNERPGWGRFVRLADGGAGLELVGPDDAVPLALPAPFDHYDARSLDQRDVGGKLVFALVYDRTGGGGKERRLHVFAVDPRKPRAALLGNVPLGDVESFAWAAAGARVALLKKNAPNAGSELLVYGR